MSYSGTYTESQFRVGRETLISDELIVITYSVTRDDDGGPVFEEDSIRYDESIAGRVPFYVQDFITMWFKAETSDANSRIYVDAVDGLANHDASIRRREYEGRRS